VRRGKKGGGMMERRHGREGNAMTFTMEEEEQVVTPHVTILLITS
jgi:hypothetical protein